MENVAFCVNQVGHVVSDVNWFKERISISHRISETKTFDWTELRAGMRDWFNGVKRNVL